MIVKKFILFLSCFLTITCLCKAGDMNAEKIYKKVNKSVVIIFTSDSFGHRKGQGSGVMLSKEGKIVTNFHVIEEAEKIEIGINGAFVVAKIIGIDAGHDLAILKIDCHSCIPIERAGKHDINIGEKIYAIGSPLGYENTISEGIISGRRHTQDSASDILQITTPVSPGSSGGAVVNSKGILIGISTIAFQGSAQNINFAVPANLIDSVILRDNISPEELIIASDLRKARMIDVYQNPQEIIQLLDEVLGYDPNNEKALQQLCHTYFITGKNVEAKKYGEKLIKLYPNNFTGLFIIGNINFKNGKYDLASYAGRKLISINYNVASGHCLLGRSYYMHLQNDSSEIELRKAVELDSTDNDAWYFLACISIDHNKYDPAKRYALNAIEYNPDYFECDLLLGKLYSIRNREEEAREYYNDAIKLNYSSPLAHILLAQSYLNDRYYEKAKQEARTAVKLNKSDCNGYEILLIADLLKLVQDNNIIDDFRHLSECDAGKAFFYTAYIDTSGIKTTNIPTEILLKRSAEILTFEDSLIQKINSEELKIKNTKEKLSFEQKMVEDYRKNDFALSHRNYSRPNGEHSYAEGTVKIAGNYYANCMNLLSFRGKVIIKIEEWLPGKEARVDLNIYDMHGNKLARVLSTSIINWQDGKKVKIRSTPEEFVCYEEGSSNPFILKMAKATSSGKGLIRMSLNLFLPDGSRLECTPDDGDRRLNFFGKENYTNGGDCIQLK